MGGMIFLGYSYLSFVDRYPTGSTIHLLHRRDVSDETLA